MRWTRRACGPWQGNKAQSLTEFALVVPLFFLLLFGILDFGRLFNVQITLQNALREAGRYAVTGQSLPGYTRVESIRQKAQQASGMTLTPTDILVTFTPEGGGTATDGAGGPGDTVTISLSYNLTLMTPIIAKFFPSTGYRFTVSTTFKNEPFC
jgi:Flp pilus assembly protein TadG